MSTKRQMIDETPGEIIEFFSPEQVGSEAFAELANMFEGIPLFDILPKERRLEIATTIGTSLMEFFKEGLAKEVESFCTYWKSVVPPEADLEKMSDGEIEEKVTFPFLRELDDLFNSWMAKVQKMLKGETE